MDPLFHGRYPDDVWRTWAPTCREVQPGDMAAIATPMDFLGINYYTRAVVSASGAWSAKASGKPLTDMGWEVCPRA
jgi:beta-glucosidase